MGYYTIFKLSAKDSEITDDMKKELSTINSYYFDNMNLIDELVEGWFEAKWYDYVDNIKMLSLKFPTIVFILEGDGEENDDMWVAYFMNGKVQYEKAKITYNSFDPNKNLISESKNAVDPLSFFCALVKINFSFAGF